MKRFLIITTTILVAIGCGGKSAQSACDENMAKNVGKLYYELNAMFELTQRGEMESFVNGNSHLLGADSPIIACMREAGACMIQKGVIQYDPSAYNDAYESALGMGANMDQANSVASSMTETAVQLFVMGQELQWLAEVVPEAARGNWGPFYSTGTQARVMMRQTWPMYQMMLDSDPSTRALLQQVMDQYQSWIEYQMAVLVFMACQ